MTIPLIKSFPFSPSTNNALFDSEPICLLESVRLEMDLDPKKFAALLDKIEAEADEFLLARNQMVENDKERNANREALTALRKRARTTKTSVMSPFDSMMKDIHGSSTKPLVQEVCSTCGSHDSSEPTWMMLPGADLFAAIPFHAVHTMLEKDEEKMEFESKKLQSLVKEKALFISELGALADGISPGVIRSLHKRCRSS